MTRFVRQPVSLPPARRTNRCQGMRGQRPCTAKLDNPLVTAQSRKMFGKALCPWCSVWAMAPLPIREQLEARYR